MGLHVVKMVHNSCKKHLLHNYKHKQLNTAKRALERDHCLHLL